MKKSGVVLTLVCAVLISLNVYADPIDPGVRGGPAGAGGTFADPSLSSLFIAATDKFTEVETVPTGLGPRFNSNSCASCHSQPAIGGTSPFVNPLIAIATLSGAENYIPYFIKPDGPIREARFKFFSDGSRDGGVHDLFTITGMAGTTGCSIAQPDFEGAKDKNNIIFRIPTPVFGGGLIESIPDKVILANKNSLQEIKKSLGIKGHENRSGNDGTITRFGWKAQNKSVLMFSGEAYNVEMGVTNELFPQERDETKGCLFNPLPEDLSGFAQHPLVTSSFFRSLSGCWLPPIRNRLLGLRREGKRSLLVLVVTCATPLL